VVGPLVASHESVAEGRATRCLHLVMLSPLMAGLAWDPGMNGASLDGPEQLSRQSVASWSA
jgi:hypothetical protein